MDDVYEEPYDYEDIDDMYEQLYIDDFDANYHQEIISSYSILDLWKDCLHPTLKDGFNSSIHLLICCFILRLTSSLGYFPSSWIHITSASAGFYCLYHFFEELSLYISILAVIGMTTMFIMKKIWGRYCGYACSVVCFSFLIICELEIVDSIQWHRIRGSQMILTMKIISLAFDVDSSSVELPSLIQCLGYYFCVGSVIFGPWVSFTNYSTLLQQKSINIPWIQRLIKCMILSYVFLTVSTCWISWIYPFNTWKWIAAYLDALSFRSSHYFVSYLSEVTTFLCGISSSTSLREMTVASPAYIEVPRSLVEVVIYWNMPMHYWLKTYVFKTARPLGKFIAVLLTYAASSLLHGLNFQLAAVLLSLGFYTYVEYVLRQKLGDTFNACILARKCKKECNHLYKSSNPYVIVINVGFGILAMFHLAYLGVMFDTSSSVQEEGYNMNHTLHKWADLNFASHWVAFATYIFNMFV